MIRRGMFISNRYEILEKVGSGGMSDVYKAKCHKLNRYVAIKVLKPEFSQDKNFVSKFRGEAQNAAGLSHPNIVSVYDVGEDRGMYYIVMEFIEGITLKQYIARKGKLSVRETLSIAIQVAQGIECAHSHQIIHRDIKPQNIIISKDGKVKVTDFGIARAASVNTHTTNAMGSVHYISPEQARGGYIDEKSDIYSLGISMFEMLTGHVPFDGDSTVTVALQHIQKQVPDLKDEIEDIPVSVEKIVLKCTQNKAERRYLKISSLISDLKKALLNPDEDFVQLEEEEQGSTIRISDDELEIIRNASGEEDKKSGASSKEEEPDEFDLMDENPKFNRIVTTAGVIIAVLAISIAIIMITRVFSGSDEARKPQVIVEETTLDPRMSVVPQLVGLSEDDARAELLKNALGIKYEYDYHDTVAKGLICAQSEQAGSVVEKNSAVTVTVSNGSERVDVPDELEGQSVDDVVKLLKSQGFKYTIQYEFSSAKMGEVISTAPGGRAQVAKGTVVNLKVSRGTDSSGDTIYVGKVPSCEGVTRKKAEAAIKSAGFKVGSVTEEYSDVVEEGRVIRMSVKSGASIPKGSTIRLLVSMGPEIPETTQPETTTVPPAVDTEPASYSASYVFAKEDLRDASGAPVTEGAVTIYVDGQKMPVDINYARVETWPGDYEYTVTESYSGNATLQLFVDNLKIVDTQIMLQ